MITTTMYDLEAGLAHFKDAFEAGGLALKMFRFLNISLRRLHASEDFRHMVYEGVQRHNHHSLQLQPHLFMPLVNNVLIGRSGNDEEQAFCRGGGLVDFDTERLEGRVFFHERVSYNGKKVIIPSYTSFPSGVSIRHGELRLQEGNARFYYSHLSEKGAYTSLWVPGRGVVKSTNKPNDVVDLEISTDVSRLERLLLIGGVNREETGGRPVVPGYNLPFYYVRLIMTSS